MQIKQGADQAQKRCTESIHVFLATALTTLSLSSASALAAQPTTKPGPDTPAACGCTQAVLAAGYTLEDDESRANHQYAGATTHPMPETADRDDKDDKDDKNDKDDQPDKDDRNDLDDKNDRDDDNKKTTSSITQAKRPMLSGLLIYEVEKNGVDYDVYADPRTCQIRAAIKDQ